MFRQVGLFYRAAIFNRRSFLVATKKPLIFRFRGFLILLSGSTTWTRTRDPVINSHLLYQLSYRGIRRMLLIKKNKSTKNCICGGFSGEWYRFVAGRAVGGHWRLPEAR